MSDSAFTLTPSRPSTPILSVTDQATRILAIALDESAFSEYAFSFALTNIIQKSDMVILLNVRSIPTTPSPFSGLYYDTSLYVQDLENESRFQSHSLLKYYSSILKLQGIAHKAIALRGDPREEILRKVDELGVKMIVLGSRGLNALKRTFLGSLSDYIIHSVDIPIVVVKHPHPEELEKYGKHSAEALVIKAQKNELKLKQDKEVREREREVLKKKSDAHILSQSEDQTRVNQDDEIVGDDEMNDSSDTLKPGKRVEFDFRRNDTEVSIGSNEFGNNGSPPTYHEMSKHSEIGYERGIDETEKDVHLKQGQSRIGTLQHEGHDDELIEGERKFITDDPELLKGMTGLKIKSHFE